MSQAIDGRVPLKEFLESAPIGVAKVLTLSQFISKTRTRRPGNPKAGVVVQEPTPNHLAIRLPRVRLFCDGECTGERFFDPLAGPNVDEDGSPTMLFSWNSWNNYFLTYRCGDCKNHRKVFALNVHCDATGVTIDPTEKYFQLKATCTKIGEVPKPTTPLNRKIKKLISEDWELYRKGADDEAAGNGIGAFAYYRRVVEASRDKIVDAICLAMEKLGISASDIEKVSAVKDSQQFSNSIDEIAHLIPADLHVAGRTPLTALYKPLSDGIHNKSDAECLELAHYVRTVLDAFGQKLQTVLEDHDKVQEALRKLEAFQSRRD